MARTGDKYVSGNNVYQLASVLNAATFRQQNLFPACVWLPEQSMILNLNIINTLKNSGNYIYHMLQH
jgi:hypothetical protein